MPYNISKSATIVHKTALKYPAPFGTSRDHVVLDANDASAFPAPTDGSRFVVPAGTILVDSTVAGKTTKYDGSNGPIKGILVEPVDMAGNATAAYEPAAAFFTGVIFATEKIVDFTLYASALVNDLPRCDFK
jgi:hypothetical protein